MRRLIAVGNGFDIAHHLPTKYGDFREYLLKQSKPSSPYSGDTADGGARHLMQMIAEMYDESDDFWKSFEGNLGKVGGKGSPLHSDVNGYIHSIGMDDGLASDAATVAEGYLQSNDVHNAILDYLSKWICKVDKDVADPPAQAKWLLHDTEDWFFTFNYTHTLEDLYGIPRLHVKHIHGEADKAGEPLIFGHAPGQPILIDENEGSLCDAATNCIAKEIHQLTQKHTEKIISDNDEYFDAMHRLSFSTVKVIGHSFSEVDYPYFESIRDAIPGALWELHCHEVTDAHACRTMAQKLNIPPTSYIVLSDKLFWI